MAADSTDFVLVLEDLKDWDNADHLAGLSLEQVRLCIAQLAGLHAWSVDPANADALGAFPSLDNQMTREVFPAVFAQGWQVYATMRRYRFRLLSQAMPSSPTTRRLPCRR